MEEGVRQGLLDKSYEWLSVGIIDREFVVYVLSYVGKGGLCAYRVV